MRSAVPRRTLSELVLTGWRRRLRAGAVYALMAAATLATLLLVAPSHSVWGGPVHSYGHDLGILPMLGLAGTAALCWWARTRGCGTALVPALLGSSVALATTIIAGLSHLLHDVSNGLAGHAFFTAVVAVFVIGLATLAIEPIVFVCERRRLERDHDPVFPTARVVR